VLVACTSDDRSGQSRIQRVDRLRVYWHFGRSDLGRACGVVAASVRAAVIGIVEPLGIVEVWHVSGGTLQTRKPARSVAADLLGPSLTVWGSVTSA
jgi:hypothetical protein